MIGRKRAADPGVPVACPLDAGWHRDLSAGLEKVDGAPLVVVDRACWIAHRNNPMETFVA